MKEKRDYLWDGWVRSVSFLALGVACKHGPFALGLAAVLLLYGLFLFVGDIRDYFRGGQG